MKDKPDAARPQSIVRPGYLYRYWADTGVLLYIGISVNAVARLAQHSGKIWFSRIATVTIQKFDTYAEAEEAELRAICYEGPIHNIKGPREAKDLGPALNRLRAVQRRSARKGYPRLKGKPDAYEADLAFGIIPADMTFADYPARPHRRRKRG